VAIITQAEKNQIVRINWFAALAGHEIELVLILLRRNLRINFTAHTQNRFFRNPSRRQKSFPGHPEVALRIIRWHTALISKRDTNQVPRQLMRDRCKPGVNRPRSVPTRKCNPEFVAFGNSSARLFKNEVSGVSSEILRSNDVATHSRIPNLNCAM
jgi:hypothetical protein